MRAGGGGNNRWRPRAVAGTLRLVTRGRFGSYSRQPGSLIFPGSVCSIGSVSVRISRLRKKYLDKATRAKHACWQDLLGGSSLAPGSIASKFSVLLFLGKYLDKTTRVSCVCLQDLFGGRSLAPGCILLTWCCVRSLCGTSLEPPEIQRSGGSVGLVGSPSLVIGHVEWSRSGSCLATC